MPAMRTWPVLLTLFATAAFAAPKENTVVLSGPAPLTKWVSKELSKRYTSKIAGRPVPSMPTAKEVRDFTAPAGAVALIICQVTGPSITLQVLNGADGTPLDTISLKAAVKKLPKVMPRPQLAALLFAVGSGKAPGKEAAPPPDAVTDSKPPPADAPPTKTEPKKEVASKPSKRDEPTPVKAKETPPAEVRGNQTASEIRVATWPALRASVGVGGFNRSFTWAGNPSPSLATASQPFSGDIAVDASWFPAAHFTQTFPAHLGLFISGNFGVGMVSRVQDSRFAHSANRLRFGALVRLPLAERFSLLLHAGYSRQELTTSQVAINDGSARPNIPDVLFNGFRGGLGLRLRIVGSLELDALGGVQLVVGKGELGSDRYFPKANAFAVDVGGGLSVELVEHVRLRAGVEWQRYFVTLNPADTSTFFAKTAADQYITATASLQWVM